MVTICTSQAKSDAEPECMGHAKAIEPYGRSTQGDWKT